MRLPLRRICSFQLAHARHQPRTLALRHRRPAAVTLAPPKPAPPASKRKRAAGDPKFYAVQAGHRPGVYTSWTTCLEQIRGFKGAKCTPPPPPPPARRD